jgi:hypothetical protein
MLSRIFGFGRSNFEAYLTNLVRGSAHGAPTADEARQDFRAAIVARAVMPRV